MKHIIILRGPSGAGKSTIAKILRKKMNGKTAILCPDPFYHEISGKELNRDIVYGALYTLTDFYLKKGYNIILEGLLTNVKNKKMRIEKFMKLGKRRSAKLTLFFLNVDVDTCMKRRDRTKYKISKNDVRIMHTKSISSRRNDEIKIEVKNKKPENIVKEILSYLK